MIEPAGSSGNLNLFTAPREGLRRGFAQAGEAAAKTAAGDLSPEPMVAQIQAEAMIKANVSVLRTADEMLGALLDAKA